MIDFRSPAWSSLAICAVLAFACRAEPVIATEEQRAEMQVSADAVPIPAGPSDEQSSNQKLKNRSSPWLVVPVVSSNPKLGTTFGGLGAYLHTFDPDSQVSLFGATYQYTSTESSIAAAFARTSFGADHHRIIALAVFGYIKNDYDDYLGTGKPLKTDDD